MTSSIKTVAFFFFAGVVFFLLAFFEKRISMVQSQVKSQMKVIEKVNAVTTSYEDLNSKLVALSQKNTDIEQQLKVITLNFAPDSGPGEQLVQDIIRQGLLLRHDLFVLWQNFIAQSIRSNHKELAVVTLSSLKTLPDGVKESWLATLQEYPTWDDLKLREFHQEVSSQSMDESVPSSMSFIKRLGFTIRRKDQSSHKVDKAISPYLETGQYDSVCHLFAKDKESFENKDILNQLCFPQKYFSFNLSETT